MSKQVEKEISKIIESRKYRNISPFTIKDIYIAALKNYPEQKTALKIAKERLHRVWADYLWKKKPDFKSFFTEMKNNFNDPNKLKELHLNLLHLHKSTSERMSGLDLFYKDIFAITGKPDTIIDAAACLHPFCLPWMELPATINYYAFDINKNIVDLTNDYFYLWGMKALALQKDVLVEDISITADVAFLFKMYHCLEKRQKGAGWRVVEKLKADWVVVTFPAISLANKKVDIAANYEDTLKANVIKNNWQLQEKETANEKIFFIKKSV
jgi:16S rRNA (guanine(1405)-N(7))-methyltransferase